MYKIFMLIAVPVLAIAWIAYMMWTRKVYEEEKKLPKSVSPRLQKTRSEVADWAKKMAQFEPPTRKKQSEQTKQDEQNKPDKPVT